MKNLFLCVCLLLSGELLCGAATLTDRVQVRHSVAKQTPENGQQVTVNLHLQSKDQQTHQGSVKVVVTNADGSLLAEKATPVSFNSESVVPLPLALPEQGSYAVSYTYIDAGGETLSDQFTWKTDPVNFFYAFTTPHRMTVALPDHSSKTMVDVVPGQLSLVWTYDNLNYYPYDSFRSIKSRWRINAKPLLNGEPFQTSTVTRAEGYLPVMESRFATGPVSMDLEIVGGDQAAMIRVVVSNKSQAVQHVQLPWNCPGNWKAYNPGWIDPTKPTDYLLAGWEAPADQVNLLGLGADAYPTHAEHTSQLNLDWTLQPGETKTGWVIRPYNAFERDVPELRTKDWAAEFTRSRQVWVDLIARTPNLLIPDAGVRNAFYAGICDLFIMREPVGKGYIATVPGTDVYRSGPNAFEPAIAAVALDQVNLPAEAESGYRVNWDLQTPDGDWTEPSGWAHLMWAASGYKAWAVMEHFMHTQDTAFLQKRYPQLLASARWQEGERKKTMTLQDGQRPLTYGLMPQGMGDGGLMNDKSFYGIYYTHNIWAVYADSLAYQAALILDKPEDAREMKAIYEAAKSDLLVAMEQGAIPGEDGKRWLSSIPGKVTGSCWGLLASIYPTGLLPADHELMTNTMERIEAKLSPGGLPLHTGFMADGMWVAIALNDFAQAHLVRDESDRANALLYAVLNHGTPLYSWCEERGQFPGTTQMAGDLQHLWTPEAVVRFMRDMLVMEQGETLHLARGTARGWLVSGEKVGIENASTRFGPVSYSVRYDKKRAKLLGEVQFSDRSVLAETILHLPLPDGMRVVRSTAGKPLSDGSGLQFTNCRGTVRFEATVARK